jgi:enoyl-CoA hydratase/carnithine racemase
VVDTIAVGPPKILTMPKHMMNRASLLDLAAAIELEAPCQAEAIVSEDHQNGPRAFFEERAAIVTGG